MDFFNEIKGIAPEFNKLLTNTPPQDVSTPGKVYFDSLQDAVIREVNEQELPEWMASLKRKCTDAAPPEGYFGSLTSKVTPAKASNIRWLALGKWAAAAILIVGLAGGFWTLRQERKLNDFEAGLATFSPSEINQYLEANIHELVDEDLTAFVSTNIEDAVETNPTEEEILEYLDN